jgi:hypothetical protein
MRIAKLIAALGVLSSALALAITSSAQTKSEPDSYLYKFVDDYMVGDTISSNTAILKVRPGPVRVTLIRPRASFVPEMLKSVEGL